MTVALEHPSFNDPAETWAVYFTAKATAAVARGDERAARVYARFAAAEVRFSRLLKPVKEEKRA